MIDCHAHLASVDFDPDRPEVLKRARLAGVTDIIVVSEDLADSQRVISVCQSHPQTLHACIGLHPDRCSENREPPTEKELEAICTLARQNRDRIFGIGEVGLDYWSAKDRGRRTLQHRFLERMADLAWDLDLPLNVHSRSAGHYTIDLLASKGAKRVLMHAFDGKPKYALQAAETHGWVFSIPPSVVRSSQKQKLVRNLPLESLALESDSPVLGPDRKARNEPANLIHAVRCIAQIKGIGEDVVREATTLNAQQLFGLDISRNFSSTSVAPSGQRCHNL
jgi:TatD DNase family protein